MFIEAEPQHFSATLHNTSWRLSPMPNCNEENESVMVLCFSVCYFVNDWKSSQRLHFIKDLMLICCCCIWHWRRTWKLRISTSSSLDRLLFNFYKKLRLISSWRLWLIRLCFCRVSVYLSHHLAAPGLNHFKGNEWSSFNGTVWLMLLWIRHVDSVQLSLMHISILWVEMSTDEVNHFQRRQVRVWPGPSDDVSIWHWTYGGLGRQKWDMCI